MKALPDLLRETASRHADERAIVFAGNTTDYRTFDARSDAVAAGLAERGIAKGDRVGLYCINSDAFAIAYFGILKAGGVVVPINLLYNPKEVQYMLDDSGARGLLYYEAFAANVDAIRADLPNVGVYVAIGAQPPPAGDHGWADLLQTAGPPPTVSFDVADDVAVIIYTSGTTGKPKGAMLTHRNLAANVSSAFRAQDLRVGEDVLLVVLPMFHAFAATMGMLLPLLNGLTIVPQPRFDPVQVADAIAAEKVTVFFAVPSMFGVLMRLPDEAVAKFASLKYSIAGGAAMPVELMRQFEEKFDVLIYEGDGPTECSPITSVNPVGGLRKPASIGLPVPDVEMKILDDNANELPHGEIGEICVRGPNVMKGYWNRPEETAASFFGEWFRTGDLGSEDDDGYFFIVDRKKDMIIVNGMNVYPRVIEEILYQYAPVAEAAVVGEAHKTHGEIPVAHVALKDGQAADADAVRTFCREHLGRHEIPRKVFFHDELPKNATGKILKRELRTEGELERGIDSRADEAEGGV